MDTEITAIKQEDIFERAMALADDAESIGVVIKLDMPTSREKAAYKRERTLIVAPNGKPGPTMLHPKPSTTGQQYE